MASLKDRLGCALGVLGALVVLVLFVIAVARSVKPGSVAPAPSAAAKPADELPGTRALLDGIGVGDALAGWRIDRAHLVKGKRLALEMRRKRTGFTIWIVRKDVDKSAAPGETDKYKLYFGNPVTYDGPIPDGAPQKVLNAITERVKRTENRVPAPAGM